MSTILELLNRFIYENEHMNNILYTISYKAVYSYSVTEYYVKKGFETIIISMPTSVKEYIKKIIESETINNHHETMKNINYIDIYFLKNNKLIDSLEVEEINDLNNMITPINDRDEYDSFVLNKHVDEKIYSQVLNYSLKESDTCNNVELLSILCQDIPSHTNYEFPLIEIIICDVNIKLELSNNQYNFYLINNKINDTLVMYLLNNYHSDDIKQFTSYELKEYKINIIDDQFNSVTVDHTQYILMKKDEYVIENNL